MRSAKRTGTGKARAEVADGLRGLMQKNDLRRLDHSGTAYRRRAKARASPLSGTVPGIRQMRVCRDC
jgi:hypothetical protein